MQTIYGLGPVLEALTARRRTVRRILVAEERRREARLEAICAAAAAAGVSVLALPGRELQRRSPGEAHQGVLAEAEQLPQPELEGLLARAKDPALVVVLDQVQDPTNLGAVLRSADGAGADGVIVPRDRSASLTPAAMKVAEGAAEHVPVVTVTNLARALRTLKDAGLWAIGLEAGAGRFFGELDLRRPLALVLGSEGTGMRRLIRETCDEVASIPMLGRMRSLNVGAAATVVLYEAVRQRGGARPLTDRSTCMPD